MKPRSTSVHFVIAGVTLFVGHLGVTLWMGTSWGGALLSNLIQLALGILTVVASWNTSRRCGRLGNYFWTLASLSYAIWVVAQSIGTYSESFRHGFGDGVSSLLFFCWFVPIGLALTLPEGSDAGSFDWLRIIDTLQVFLFWSAAYSYFHYASRNAANGTFTPILYYTCYSVLTAAFFLRAWTTGSTVARALLSRAGLFLLASQGISALYSFGPGKDLPCGAWFDLLWSVTVLISLIAAAWWHETNDSYENQPDPKQVNRQVFAELFSLLYPLLTFVMVAPTLRSRSNIGPVILLSSLACTAVRLLMTQRNLVIVKHALLADLSSRRQAEQALRESEERFRGAFDFAAIGMAIVSPPGRWLRVNQSLCSILGYTSEELLTMDFQSITHPEDLEMDLIVGRKLIERSIPFIFLEKRFVHKSGKIVWTLISVSLVRDPEGKPMYSVAQIQDITQRKEAEEAHQQSEERFAKAFGSNPEGISVSTLSEGRILEVNDAYVRLIGYERNQLIGKTVRELGIWNPGERDRVVGQLRNHESIRKYETTFHIAGGKTIQVQISLEQIQVQHVPCLLTSIRDITESRLLEKRLRAVQKMEAIGSLAGGVAHDFNNLLMIISGSAQLMKAKFPSDANPDYLGHIESAVEKGAALTRQLLAFSRRQVLNPVVLNVNAVIHDLWKLLPRLLGEDVETTLILAPDLNNVNADRSQIEQVIMNLSVNARDAMPKGGKLLVETANVELDQAYTTWHGTEVPPGHYVMLSVTDTGEGMDPRIQARIFEPFFTTKELGKGTGLGLATVYGIVKQSGGYVWVYSEVGKGTSFKVYLPAETLPVDSTFEPQPIALPRTAGETILLVEDNVELRELTATYLDSCGYKVLEAGNRDEALRICRKYRDPIHVLLTDVVLPGGGGPDLARAALEIRPDLRMIYMSGYPDRVLGTELICDKAAFLQKPFSLDALTRALSHALHTPMALPVESASSSRICEE